jgi:competence protein ComGC
MSSTHQMNDKSLTTTQQHQWLTLKWLLVIVAILVVVFIVDIGNLGDMRNENKDISEKHHTEVLGIKQTQIQNYIEGTGLMLSLHVTHHGGTYFCSQMKRVGKTPSFACMNGGRDVKTNSWPVDDPIIGDMEWRIKTSMPWEFNETDLVVEVFRKYFHMISWEFDVMWGRLASTNWHHPKLLSVVIMRHPLERFLAGGKCGKFRKSIEKDLAEDPSLNHLYWQYANDWCADNFALRVFTGSPGCCKGAETKFAYLEQAKQQIDQFTILIDQTCETESIVAMSELLHLNLTVPAASRSQRPVKTHPPVRDRLRNDTLYHYLQEKFKLDMELYEYAKSKSILDCSTLTKNIDE